MNLSKEFLEWWESFLKKCNYTREQVFGDKCNNNSGIIIPIKWVDFAFHAHDKELDRLRKFEKKVRKLQNKIAEYEGKSADCYVSNPDKSINYEAKAEELKDELLYL